MVDFIITDFSNVRGGGNIVDTVPSAEDFIVDNCTISSSSSGVFVLTPGESLVGTVSLFANHTSITVGESVVFSATVEDTDGEPLEGLTVSFYRDGVSLGSGVSDDTGLVQLTVSSWSSGSFTCTASCQGVSSSSVSVTVSKITSTLSLSAASSTVIVGSDVSLSGTLSVGSGESVKIYQGTTLIDTVTTSTDGAFSKTVSGLSAGTYAFKATYDGDSTHASVESSTVSVTVGNKPVPTISLGASSSSITVGNSVTMSGQLVYGSTALSNASVKIYNGSTLVDTVSTNSQGYYTKSVSGLTVGTHSFTAVFEGDSSYASVTSTAVTVTVNKITSTITFATSSASVTVGNSFTLSGTLSVGSGASVKLYMGTSLMDTLTTGTNGTFSKTITAVNTGTFSFKATYDGDTTHTSVESSSVSVTVTSAPTPVPASISLTSDKSILSYADSQSATLSATVLDDNDDPLEGETVTFYKGSTSIGTATTNSSGIATKSYSATGAGDVTFKASVGMIVSETYSIEDCYDYDTLTSNNNKFTGTGITPTYSSNGLSVKGNANSDSFYLYNGTLPSTFSIEFEFVSITYKSTATGRYSSELYCCGIEVGDHQNDGIFYGNGGSLTYTGTHFTTGDKVKLEYNGSNVKVYQNSTLITTLTKANTNVGFKTHNTRNITVKNMKIKPL